MHPFRNALLILSLSLSSFALAQTSPGGSTGSSPGQGATTPGTGQPGGYMAASSSLKILSPTVDQKIGSSTLSVRYEVTNQGASAAPSPTFRLQLDGRDPVETLGTEYSFTGLTPGAHSITIEMVDANHTPIGGSQAVVHFKTFTAGAKTPTSQAAPTSPLSPPPVVKAKMALPTDDQLPAAGGELPLLSMVGLGVLAGGLISAMRTRK
jgi:hypothetical protein